jgi:hypothetical protein
LRKPEKDWLHGLSAQARRNIEKAHIEGDLKVGAALEEAAQDNRSQRAAERRANIEKARIVITATAAEFWAMGKRGREFFAIMDEQIEAAVNSLELDTSNRNQFRREVARDYKFREPEPELVSAAAPPDPRDPEEIARRKVRRTEWLNDKLGGIGYTVNRAFSIPGGTSRNTVKVWMSGITRTHNADVRKGIADRLTELRVPCIPKDLPE